jgi:nitroreductase
MRKELILEVIQDRWSPYSFSSNQIEDYKIKAMMEAAGQAPSCNNEQPWMFVIATRQNMEVFEAFLRFMADGNRVWAKNAYAIIISMAHTKFTHNGNLNRWAFHDTGMAVSNMLTQAYAMDVYVHQMAGYNVDMVKKYFKLNDDIEPVAMMAVGYLGDGELLSPELAKRDENRRPRKQINEFVFKNTLTNPAF